METVDEIRTLAGNALKCVRIEKKSEKAMEGGKRCSSLKCEKKAEMYFVVKKCNKNGDILDDKDYIIPFCENHSAVNSVYEIKFKTEFIDK